MKTMKMKTIVREPENAETMRWLNEAMPVDAHTRITATNDGQLIRDFFEMPAGKETPGILQIYATAGMDDLTLARLLRHVADEVEEAAGARGKAPASPMPPGRQ